MPDEWTAGEDEAHLGALRPLRAEQLGAAPLDDADGDGLSAQLLARERASAEDARTQAPNRLAAAARAAALLRADVATEPVAAPLVGAAATVAPVSPVAPVVPTVPDATTGDPIPEPAEGPDPLVGDDPAWAAAAAPVAPPSERPLRPADRPAPPRGVPGGGPAAVVTSALATAGANPALREPMASGTPIAELRPSALGADVDQLGDTLLVYVDRLEHRDRHGRLRRRMPTRDVLDVEVQKRLTGASFTVRSAAGVDLVLRGVRLDAAEEVRDAILANLPAARRRAPVAAPAPPAFDEAGLLRKLVDLYRAGVLSDDELSAKTEVVARLAREASAVAAPGPEARPGPDPADQRGT